MAIPISHVFTRQPPPLKEMTETPTTVMYNNQGTKRMLRCDLKLPQSGNWLGKLGIEMLPKHLRRRDKRLHGN
ncbi:ATP-dependent RNA helicase DEAH13 isoform X1 [Sesbania bispinosa]|nr:ATP-dependent RNA helicase DEAH13 isoform X1 [Sesbania bispinosa]